MKLLDTCFMIHLQREWVRKQEGPAKAYLQRHGQEEFVLSSISVLEFLEGYARPAEGQGFLSAFPTLAVTAEVAVIGSRLRRKLRERGERIGDFDILIAATALHAGLTLVTDNTRHFERIEGLLIEGYR